MSVSWTQSHIPVIYGTILQIRYFSDYNRVLELNILHMLLLLHHGLIRGILRSVATQLLIFWHRAWVFCLPFSSTSTSRFQTSSGHEHWPEAPQAQLQSTLAASLVNSPVSLYFATTECRAAQMRSTEQQRCTSVSSREASSAGSDLLTYSGGTVRRGVIFQWRRLPRGRA